MIINDKENYDKIKKSISMNNLKKIINSKKYTITKVAMEFKVSVSTINSYLNGQKIPSITSLISIETFLNCNLDYLLGRTDNPIKINDIENLFKNKKLMLLFNNISSLTKEKQTLVAAYVKGLIEK